LDIRNAPGGAARSFISLSLCYTHSALKCDYTLFCSRDAEEEVDARRMLLVAVIDILRTTGDFLRGNTQKIMNFN
jgi:hypothetical protein